MTIFELVKIALDELYIEGQKNYGDNLDSEIKKRMDYLQVSYNKLNKAGRVPIDYQDPATRFAYVFKYVAAHGDYVTQVMDILRHNRNPESLFNSDVLRVSCIGGGPGSDIIAIVKYLDQYAKSEPVKKVICYLLDKEQAWADTWTELGESMKFDFTLNVNFQPLDVTDPGSWKAQQKFLQADLFTMSYFVSEVFALDDEGIVTEFWQTLFASAKPGALFLYDDNGHDDFNKYFDQQWQQAGLECILDDTNVRFVPRMTERSAELGIYREKFGQSPKLQAQLSYRILRKN